MMYSNCFAINGVTTARLILDVLSPLLSILSPPIRPVNFSLLNATERHDMNALLDALIAVQVAYRPDYKAYGHG
jgi:hypothetical protein